MIFIFSTVDAMFHVSGLLHCLVSHGETSFRNLPQVEWTGDSAALIFRNKTYPQIVNIVTLRHLLNMIKSEFVEVMLFSFEHIILRGTRRLTYKCLNLFVYIMVSKYRFFSNKSSRIYPMKLEIGMLYRMEQYFSKYVF